MCIRLSMSPIKGPHTRSKKQSIFWSKKWTSNFDKIFDAILHIHVPSKFWSKFIVLKMFDPDATVAIALVLAKCSPEDWIFDQNFDRSPHTRQNIEELSKYWRLVKIYQTDGPFNILSQCIFWQKISHTRSKIQSKFWCKFFASIYWRIFWSCMGPLRVIYCMATCMAIQIKEMSQSCAVTVQISASLYPVKMKLLCFSHYLANNYACWEHLMWTNETKPRFYV